MAAIKFVGGVLLLCLVRPGASNKTVASPCCEDGRILDVEQQKCVLLTEEFVTETYAEETQATDPHIRCSNGWANFTTVQRATGALVEPRFNKTLTIDEYCIHSVDDTANETTILHCQPKAAVINKCCPDGYAVNRTSVGECVPTENTFNASIYVKPAGYPFTLRPGVTLTCDNDFNVYLPNVFHDHSFNVLDSGQLHLPATVYSAFQNSSDYCIDSTIDTTGAQQPIAVTCLPRRMYIVRTILLYIFPFTQYFSAFLLFVTLVVYISFPALRNNLQGKAMICFLASVLIVQLEYGTLLSLPSDQPYTWCSFRKKTAIYFRGASSTWLTVMGFVIWRQLKYYSGKNQSNKTMNEWIQFLLLSIYAWGLALVLYFIIRYNTPFPEGARVCWMYVPTVRWMMQMPNFVLVTLNLVFFIPNVIQVHSSIKFLRTAVTPVDLGRMEKQRLAAIFRLFLLMEACTIHYTLPSLVNEIFHFNAAGPELVFYNVSFGQFVGPAIFYFFICKPDVISMIKEVLESVCQKRQLVPGFPLLFRGRHRSYSTSDKPFAGAIGNGRYKSMGEDNASSNNSSSNNSSSLS